MFQVEMAAADMQPSMQQTEQRRSRGRPFVKGISGNPNGSRLIIERRGRMEAEIAADLGGNLSAVDRVLLSRGVELLTRKPRSHTDAVRLVNAATRIIDKLRAKYQSEEIVPSLREFGL